MLLNGTISDTNKVKQRNGNIVSDMGGEKVMLSVKNGKYYNLGNIGGEIWGLIEEGMTVSQLVNILMAKYNVEKGECEEHVISFLDHLIKEDLIEVAKN